MASYYIPQPRCLVLDGPAAGRSITVNLNDASVHRLGTTYRLNAYSIDGYRYLLAHSKDPYSYNHDDLRMAIEVAELPPCATEDPVMHVGTTFTGKEYALHTGWAHEGWIDADHLTPQYEHQY